jgi:hypothetical protein
VQAWLNVIKAMKNFPRPGRKVNVTVTPINVAVSLESKWPENKCAPVWQPGTLADAMLVQLVQSVTSGLSVQTCEQCGQWFERGGARGKARRSISRFCSERCKNRHHYAQRKASK